MVRVPFPTWECRSHSQKKKEELGQRTGGGGGGDGASIFPGPFSFLGPKEALPHLPQPSPHLDRTGENSPQLPAAAHCAQQSHHQLSVQVHQGQDRAEWASDLWPSPEPYESLSPGEVMGTDNQPAYSYYTSNSGGGHPC